MTVLGRVVSITRYPVKSMAGELVECGRLVAYGLEHDRLYAFESSGAPAGMLRLTGRVRREMLRYRPRVLADGSVEVAVPGGDRFAVDSAEMLGYLREHVPGVGSVWLTREDRPQTDVRPLSLLSVETVEALSGEMGVALDARRFRANLMLSMEGGAFAEEGLVGRTIGVGSEARLLIRERIPRCRFVTYDPAAPEVGEPLFGVMKMLERRRQGRTGIYASVVTPGRVRGGDEVWVAGDVGLP